MVFEEFVHEHEKRLRAGLVAAYGPTIGMDCAAEAMAYGWENWSKLKEMDNPAGYLFRVGQTAARTQRKPSGYLPRTLADHQHGSHFEPGLASALERLTEPQRIAVVLVHGLGWSLVETANVLDISISSVRTHIQRAMTKLRTSLKVDSHAS